MNNDLISREALKEEIRNNKKVAGRFIEGVIMLIDNAPTVKAENASLLSENDLETIRTILNAHIGCLCNNGQHTQAIVIEQVRDRLFGVLQSKNERPQGDWGKWVISEIQCPNCFEYFETDCYSTEELKKCPNCGTKMIGGADMRKGGKE